MRKNCEVLDAHTVVSTQYKFDIDIIITLITV